MNKVLVLFFSLLTFSGFSQVVVEPEVSPDDLVFDFLLGAGVLIENVQFAGSDIQIGAFNDNGVFGLDSGLVMSTAHVENLDASNEVIQYEDVTWGEGVNEDPDLLAVANEVPSLIGQNFSIFSVNDVASIEFDFIPYGDSLAFNYVFGSNEYLAWVNTAFNDAFAFFVSGPGIEGPYSSPADFPGGSVNIAYVPGTDPALPITVSSVNDVLNSEYYVTPNPQDVVINGHTTVFTAALNGLQVGETYHMRLVIGDGSDSALESIVALQAGSFSAYTTVDNVGDPGDFDGDGDIDVSDLLLLLADQGCEGFDCVGDLNGDGITNVMDILDFLALF